MPSVGPTFPGPSSGLLVSPQVGTYGITVGDAAGVTRVQLGQIGTTFGQNYGLKVVSADGSTVIIDGTSDIFKIAASGTLSTVIPAGGTNSATVTLTGLGALPATPVQLSYLMEGANLPSSTNILGLNRLRTRWYVAGSSGAAATNQAIVVFSDCQGSCFLDGSSLCTVQLGGDNAVGISAHTYYSRWYVLTQAAM